MRFFSTRELSARWQVSEGVVRTLIGEGALAASKLGGRLGVPASSVADFEGVPGPLHPDRLMTAEEVAREAIYAPSTILVYARKGLIPSCRVGGKRRFRRDAIHSWLSGAFEPTP